MAKRSISGFPAVLNEPILKTTMFDFGEIPGTTEADRQEAYERRLQELRVEKLSTLLKHYRIPAGSEHRWEYLAYCLACELFPGMDVVTKVPKRARPRGRWANELAPMLVGVIDKILAELPEPNVLAAIEFARERDPERWGKYKASTLEARYYELKRAAQRRPDFSKFMLPEFLSKEL